MSGRGSTKMPVNKKKNSEEGLWMCLFIIGISLVSVTALILGIISVAHVDNHPGEDISTFCVDIKDANGFDADTRVVGRLAVSAENRRVCADMFYIMRGGCTFDGLTIRGPVNSVDGMDSNDTVATLVDVDTEVENGTIAESTCASLSVAQTRALLKNPALYYVQVTGTGACAEGGSYVYRDQITSLCHNPSYDSDDVYTGNYASTSGTVFHSAKNGDDVKSMDRRQYEQIKAELRAHRGNKK